MINLLKLEWLKFKSNAAIELLVILFVLLFPILILGGKDIFVNVPPPLPSNRVFYEFPTVWEYQGYVGSWLVFFFLGFVAIYIVTSEVSNKTLRQNIIIGLTRKEYFFSKLISIITMALVATLIYTISTILIGLIHTPGADLALIFDNNYAILKFFLMCMGYMSFGLMLGFIIRRGGISIFLYMSYVLFIEPILKWSIFGLMNWERLKGAIGTGEIGETGISLYNFVNYFPMNVIEDLNPLPLLRLPDTFMDGRDDIDFQVILSSEVAILVAFIYISIFIFLAYKSFMKRDI